MPTHEQADEQDQADVFDGALAALGGEAGGGGAEPRLINALQCRGASPDSPRPVIGNMLDPGCRRAISS